MKFQSVSQRFDPIPVVKSKENMTVPDMSFTPREIIQKFSRGEKVPLGFKGLYDSEDYVDNDRFMDNFTDDPELALDDPTRDPSFDFGDYTEEKIALEKRKRAEKRRSKVEAGARSKRKASDEELSASDSTKRATTSGEGAPAPNGQTEIERSSSAKKSD